jgi:hypothetical protein
MFSEPLPVCTVGEIARGHVQLVPVLADLGIGPQYVSWKLQDAVQDLHLDLGQVLRRLEGGIAVAA